MLENGRSKKENGGVIIEGKKKGHHKDIQRWEMTSRSVKEKKCKSSSTYLQLNDKNAINNKHLQKEVLIPSWFFSFHRHRCWFNILEIKALDSCCFCLLLLILATYFILNLLAKTDDANSNHSATINIIEPAVWEWHRNCSGWRWLRPAQREKLKEGRESYDLSEDCYIFCDLMEGYGIGCYSALK